MFVPKSFFERFMAVLENQHRVAAEFTEISLQRVLAAKDEEVRAILAAKDSEIRLLTETISDLKEAANHERHRAEAAVDILLTKHAAGPIRNADLLREVAEKQAATASETEPAKNPEQAFAQVMKAMGRVGEDDDDAPMAPDEMLTIGGSPVMAR